MADDYEIISHREIKKLRDQLKNLDIAKPADSKGLNRSISSLNEKLDALLDIFDAAIEDMREEDKESEIIKEKINPIIEKLNDIDEQNRKLAQGMVAVNSLLDEKLDELNDMIKAVSQSQQDLKGAVQDAIHEMKMSHVPAMPASTPSPSLDLHPDLHEPRLGLNRDIPPLPGSRKPAKKKFKLF